MTLLRDTIRNSVHLDVMKMSLEILLLVSRTPRILLETELSLSLFLKLLLNLRNRLVDTPVWS